MVRTTLPCLLACTALLFACGGDDGSHDPPGPGDDGDGDSIGVDSPSATPELYGIEFGTHQSTVVTVADDLKAHGMSDATLEALLLDVKSLSAPDEGLVGGSKAGDVGTWFAAALARFADAHPADVAEVLASLIPTMPEATRLETLQLLVGRSVMFWDPDPIRANPLLNALVTVLEDHGYAAIVLFPEVDPNDTTSTYPNPVIQIAVATGGARTADADATDSGSGSGGDGSGSGAPDGGVPGDGGMPTGSGCGQVRPAFMPDPWCDEHKDDLANATIGCISAAVCGVLADKLGGSIAANLAADGVCDRIAAQIKSGMGIQNTELGPPYLQDAPKPLTAIFKPIDLAQKLVSCGINLPAAVMVAGFHHLYCFDYTSVHGQPVQYQPCQPPAQQQQPGNAVCSRASGDDPSCSASSAGQGCDGGSGTCQLGVAGSGCRCVH